MVQSKPCDEAYSWQLRWHSGIALFAHGATISQHTRFSRLAVSGGAIQKELDARSSRRSFEKRRVGVMRLLGYAAMWLLGYVVISRRWK
jgi:hypothetical protein